MVIVCDNVDECLAEAVCRQHCARAVNCPDRCRTAHKSVPQSDAFGLKTDLMQPRAQVFADLGGWAFAQPYGLYGLCGFHWVFISDVFWLMLSWLLWRC